MEEPQHDDVGACKLVAQQVAAYAVFTNLSRIELAEPRASTGKIEESFRRLAWLLFDLARTNKVIGGHEVSESIDVVARL